MGPSLRTVGTAAGVAVAAAAATAAAGFVAQRRTARSILRRYDPEADEDLLTPLGHERRITTDDGVVLAVDVVEPRDADAVTVVFIHGYALNATTWHYQLRDLEGLGRLVAYDQRGHGRSEPGDTDTSYHFDRLADDLLTVIDATAPTGPVVLVGHSMGGMTIMALADARPGLFGDRIVGVCFVASAATTGPAGELAIAGPLGEVVASSAPLVSRVIASRPGLLERGLRWADDLLVVLTEHYGFGGDAPPSLVEHTKRMHALVPVPVLVALLPAFSGLDLAHALEPIKTVETAIVVGDKDRMAPVALSEDLLVKLPHAELTVLTDTGHMLMMERYAEVNHVVRELLLRVRRTVEA
jgi:pimeloyl-ACP methyl ester carboxylesterase